MSKILTLEIPDEVFRNFQKQAESRGETAEKLVLEIVLKTYSKTNNTLSNQEKDQALEKFMKHAGAINSGNPRSADNEQIDADLAAEYGRGL